MKKEFEKTGSNILSSISSMFGVYWMLKYKMLLHEKKELEEDLVFLDQENKKFKSLIWFLYVVIFVFFLIIAVPTRASADEITYSSGGYTRTGDSNNWTIVGSDYSKNFSIDSACSNPVIVYSIYKHNEYISLNNLAISDSVLATSTTEICSDGGHACVSSGLFVPDVSASSYDITFSTSGSSDSIAFYYDVFCNVDPENPVYYSKQQVSTWGLGSDTVYTENSPMIVFTNGVNSTVSTLANVIRVQDITNRNYPRASYSDIATTTTSYYVAYNANSVANWWMLNYYESPPPPFEIDWLGVGSQYFDSNGNTRLPIRYDYCDLDSSNSWHGLYFKMYKSGDNESTGYSPRGLNFEVNQCRGFIQPLISLLGYGVDSNLLDYFAGYTGEVDLYAYYDSEDSATFTMVSFPAVFSNFDIGNFGFISPLFYRLSSEGVKTVNIKTLLEYEMASSTEPNSLGYYIETSSGYNTIASSSLDLELIYYLPSSDSLSSSTRICIVGNHSYCSDVLVSSSGTTTISLIDIVTLADVRSNFSVNTSLEFVDVLNTVSSPNFYYSIPLKIRYLFSTVYLDSSVPDGGFIANLINSLNDRLDGLFPFSLINLFKNAWLNPNTEFTGGLVFFERYFNDNNDLVLPLPDKFVEITNSSSSVPIISADMFFQSEEMTGAFAMIKDVLSVLFYLVYAVFLYYLGKKTYKLLMTRA